jgi:hypothetical protein
MIFRGTSMAAFKRQHAMTEIKTPALECLWFETAYSLVNCQLYFSDL